MGATELEIKDTTASNTSASYLDLLLSSGKNGQLHTSLYDTHDDFNLHITKVSFLSSNIPSSPAYGVLISQIIQYARVWSSYECFIISCKFLGQEYVRERLKSSLRKFYGRYWDLIKQYEVPLSKMLHEFVGHDTLHWPDISLNRYFLTELDLITVFDVITLFREVSIGHLQRVQLANRGRLLLRTPSPVPFGTCICSNVETILSWTCHVYRPFEFRTYLGTSIFRFVLICDTIIN